MNALLSESVIFGVYVSLVAFFIGLRIQKRTGFSYANPLIIAQILVVCVLVLFRIDYKTYEAGARYLSYFLTPATVCLAIPLYEQFELLKGNLKAVLLGIAAGVLTSAVSIFVMAKLFQFDHAVYVSFLPKSITTAIGIELTAEMGGYISLTMAAIVLTGLLGNVAAESLCQLCGIRHPIAIGVAIGTSSHAVGTAKALEINALAGAISGLSMVIAGLMTVIAVNLFGGLI